MWEDYAPFSILVSTPVNLSHFDTSFRIAFSRSIKVFGAGNSQSFKFLNSVEIREPGIGKREDIASSCWWRGAAGESII